jgi:hypothetical protein
MAGLSKFVDGEHYFDTLDDDVLFEFRYDFPGWPQVTRGRVNSDFLKVSLSTDPVSSRERFAACDVVDGARSRHRSAIGWFVRDESHEGSRPHANYHNRFGYRQERVPGSRDRRQPEKIVVRKQLRRGARERRSSTFRASAMHRG